MLFSNPLFASFKKSLENGYLRSVGLLMTGTSIAQIINILVLPVLTRLYTPFEFDALTVFMSATVIVSLGASLGYDLAIPIAENSDDARYLSWIAAGCALFISLIFTLVLLIVPDQLFNSIFHEGSNDLSLLLLPLSCFITALSINFENLFVQAREFRIISAVKIAQAITGSGLQTGLFYMGWGGNGLIIGFLAMSAVPSVLLGLILLKRRIVNIPSLVEIKAAAIRYSRFPQFTAVESFANAGSVFLPLIIISSLAPGTQAAYLMLALRVMQAPFLLMARAVSQVAQSHTVEWKKAGDIGSQVTIILQNLISLTLGATIAIMLTAPFLAGSMFGERWNQVGIYFSMILPVIFFQVISYIMMPAVYTHGLNKIVMSLTIFGMLFRIGFVLIFSYYSGVAGAIAYCVTGAIYYFITIIVYGKIIDLNFKKICTIKKFGLYLFIIFNSVSLVIALSV